MRFFISSPPPKTNANPTVLHSEILPLLYAPTFALFDSPHPYRWKSRNLKPQVLKFKALFLHDGGPARHLRHVRIQIDSPFPYPRTTGTWPPTTTWNDDPMIDTEVLLWSLARNATRLERLDLEFSWSFEKYFPKDWGLWVFEGVIRRLEEGFSWVEPLLGLDLSEGAEGSEPGAGRVMLKERQVEGMLGLLAPGDDSLREAVKEAVEIGTTRRGDLMLDRLYLLECTKLFWGVRMLGILTGFSKTLKKVGLAAPVDERWNAKVREEVGVEVEVLPLGLWSEVLGFKI